VTETSNWRRHPDNRDMLLCNQCGGYVRKHGKLSQERKERVAAQQTAAAVSGHAPRALEQPMQQETQQSEQPEQHLANGLLVSGGSGSGFAANGMLPLFQAAPLAMPPPPPMAPPEPPCSADLLLPEQQAQAAAVEAAMAAVGHLAGSLLGSAAPHDSSDQEAGGAAADMAVGAAQPAPWAEAGLQPPQQETRSLPDAADAAVSAALVDELFAPWRQELEELRERRQAVAALVAAAFAPWLSPAAPDDVAAGEAQPKLEKAAPAPQEADQRPLDQAIAEVKQELPELVAVLSAPPVAPAQRRSGTAALAAAAAAPPLTRTGSGGMRRAAAVAAAAAPAVGCGDSCLNRISFIHCDRSTCPCADRCTNRPFVELALPHVEVFLTPDKGWGVRSAAFIPRGSFIVEYAGEVRRGGLREGRRLLAGPGSSGGGPAICQAELVGAASVVSCLEGCCRGASSSCQAAACLHCR
jgi:hypothetical protein